MVCTEILVNILEELLLVSDCSLDAALIDSDSFLVDVVELLVLELLIGFSFESSFFTELG